MSGLSHGEYARLLWFRTTLRRFERWSQQQAQQAGLPPAQHQLLLTIKGHGHRRGPTISDIAEYLGVRHHSAVGLVHRASEAGLIVRTRDAEDARAIRVTLTRVGQQRIEQLSELHLAELSRLAPLLSHLTTSPDPFSPNTADSVDEATNDEATNDEASHDEAANDEAANKAVGEQIASTCRN